MELREYLLILRRNWLIITACALVGLLGGGIASMLARPTYMADTQLFVAIQGSGSIQELQQGNTFTQARVQSYVKTINTPLVLQPAIDALGLHITPQQLSSRVKASASLDTVLIDISVSDESPVQAAAIAKAIAESLISGVDSLEKPKTGGLSPVSISVITPATAPVSPASPNTRLNLIVGLLSGVAIGIIIAVAKTLLDTRIRGEVDLRQVTNAPLLAGITFSDEAVKKPLLTQTNPQSPRAESFRQMRTNLQFANISAKAKTVMITSSVPGEGKSTTASNLAIAMAQAGHSVCLIDADLRRPMIGEYLGLDRSAGLTTALLGHGDINELLQPWGENSLYVLTSGQIPPNPSELLGSMEMKNLLQSLELAFDTVIIDAPPLLPVTDGAVLSQYVSGVVLVVGSQKVRQQDLAKSISALEMVGASILGCVLNRLPSKGADSYSYSYYGQASGTSKLAESGSSGTRQRLTRMGISEEHLPELDTASSTRQAGRFPL